MSQYGPISLSTLATTDMIAPGMPIFIAANQLDNATIKLTITLPTMDANGANLTGLTKLTVVSAVMTGGENPLENKSMAELLAMAGVQKVDVAIAPTDAGLQKEVNVPIMNLGGIQAFAAACAD